MKKLEVCFVGIALLFIGQLNAQNWCPPGAEWYFSYAEVSTGQVGYLHVEYLGDTIVNGTTYQILDRFLDAYDYQSQTYYNGYLNPIYTTVSGGLVQMTYNLVDLDTIYDFDAVPGDSWEGHLHTGYYTYEGILVNDTGTIVIDGVPLKFKSVEYVNGVIFPEDTLIERLGFLRLTMQTIDAFWWDVGVYELRCYSDQDITYQNPAYPTCDFILGLEEIDNAIDISVFPNPGKDRVFIEANEQFGTLHFELFDVFGRLVKQENLISNTSLDVSDLSVGVYLYVVQNSKGKRLSSGHWAKE